MKAKVPHVDRRRAQVTLSVLLSGLLLSALADCSSKNGSGGVGGAGDVGVPPACPNLTGTWRVGAKCQGPSAYSQSTFAGVVSQNECQITLTQSDDRTPTQWISTGTIDSTGKVSLSGDFGFTDSPMCDLEVTSDTWSGACASTTKPCTLEAQKVLL